MPKRYKKSPIRCQEHDFSLKPKGDYLVHAQNYNVSFCTLTNEKNQKNNSRLSNTVCSGCPVFNADGNHATPGFMLPSEKVYYCDRGDKMRDDHQRKYQYFTDEKSEHIPKPKSKSSFCSVCRQNYQDYLQHISSVVHKRKIAQNLFNRYILQLTQKPIHYQPSLQTSTTSNQDKMILTPSTLSRIQESDDVEIISNPIKKVKPNQNQNRDCINQCINQYNCVPNVNYGPQMRFPGEQIGLASSMHCYLKNLNELYQQQLQQLSLNYNMNFYLSQFPYLSLPFTANPYRHLQSFPYLNYPRPVMPNLMKPKEVCIVIDE